MKNKFIVKYKKIGGSESESDNRIIPEGLYNRVPIGFSKDIKDRNNKEEDSKEEEIDSIKAFLNDEEIDSIKELYKNMVTNNECLINPILCKEIPSIIKYLRMYNVKDFNNNDFFSDERFTLEKFNSELETENFKRNNTHFNEDQKKIDKSNQFVFNNIISRYFKLNDLSLNKLNLIEYKNRGEKLIVGDDLKNLNGLKNFIFNQMRKLTKNIGDKQYNSNEQDQEIENYLKDNLKNTMFLYGIPSSDITIPFLLLFDEARKIIRDKLKTPIGMTSVLEFKII